MKLKRFLPLPALVFVLGSCGSDPPEPTRNPETNARLPEGLILSERPEGGVPLASVKTAASVGDTVTFLARIGGRKKPFAEGRAVMVVIDPGLSPCTEECGARWYYCCETPETKLANTASVQIVDEKGATLALSLKGQSGLEELKHVAIVGDVVEKDDNGLFVVNAKGIFVGP